MNKSLFSISILPFIASIGMTASAGTVTIPNTFSSGTPAVAAEVNANFSAVKSAVDGNAGDIATNTGNISTNTGAIATNTGNITTNTGAIATNTGNITTNTTNISANTAAISALQASSGCPADMVAVGSICVDLYEARLYDAATGGNPVTGAFCNVDGSDCGDGLATAIYAISEAGALPTASVTWYQANQACANVGKRLPTTAEWQMAAAGTPAGTTDCNAGTAGTVNNGSLANCVSTAGAFDMVGNLWEWAAELDYHSTAAVPNVSQPANTDDLIARVLGESWNNTTGTPATNSIFLPTSRALATNTEFGFRCVK